MKQYEFMMIVNPELSDDARTTLIDEIKADIGEVATIVKEEDQGVKDFAYKIRNSSKGYYILWTLESKGKDFFAFMKSLNIKKDVWRNLLVKLDD